MTPPQRHIRKILLVENDAFFSTAVSEHLHRFDFEVMNARDGMDALEKIHALKPDCVILDLVMPKIDGERVCRVMKSDPVLKSIPIILLSGVARESLPPEFVAIPDFILTKGPLAMTLGRLQKILQGLNEPITAASLEKILTEGNTQLERRRIVSELLSRTRFQDAILNHITNGIIVTDLEGRILLFNQAAEIMLEREEVQVLGEDVKSVLPELFQHGNFQKIASFRDVKGTADRFHYRNRHFHVHGASIKEEGGDLGFLMILHDLTEEWKHEKEREKFRLELEETVQKRTAELAQANTRLQSINLDLAQANHMKSEFVANMSHELRSPLNDILGFTQLLEARTYGEITARQEEAIHLISESAQVLLQYINAILDFSRLEIGEEKVQLEPIDLPELLEEVHKSGKHLLRGRPIKFILDVKEGIPPVVSDRGKVRQIITNLVHNAIKFTKRGSIKISAKPLVDDKGVECIVEDTGIGIDKKNQQVIFDPFRQVDGSSTREYGGSGLGLAIARSLINLLQGEISLKSSLNLGSTFRVTFPLRFEEKKEEGGNA